MSRLVYKITRSYAWITTILDLEHEYVTPTVQNNDILCPDIVEMLILAGADLSDKVREELLLPP